MDVGRLAYDYGWIIAVVLVLCLGLYYLYKRRGAQYTIEFVRELAYMAFLAAEKKYGRDAGKVKLEMAVDIVYDRLPWTMKFLFSREDITHGLQTLYEEMYGEVADYLDDGIINGSTESKTEGDADPP